MNVPIHFWSIRAALLTDMRHLSYCNSYLKVLTVVVAKAAMKRALYMFAVLASFMVLVNSTPLQKQFEDTYQRAELETGHVIVKRTTCGFGWLTTKGLKLGPCTVHCIAMGKKSGYCTRRNVCKCRK